MSLGRDIQVILLGKVVVDILTKEGEHKVMHDVIYVTGLKHNLMSIG